MIISAVGVDLAKNVFQIHAVDEVGRAVLRRDMTPTKFIQWASNLAKCQFGMEACAGSHHLARELSAIGHEVKLIAPQFVKPFVKTNKNDRADAEAIVEAMQRPTMRFVSVKEKWQQEILALHRIRSRLVKNRTALINEVRAILFEYGIRIPKGRYPFKKEIFEKIETLETSVTFKSAVLDLYEELNELEVKIKKLEDQINQTFKSNPECQRVGQIMGIGPLTATTLVAMIGDPKSFKSGREFSAYLGLVPRQHSSGGKDRLLGISKRGDTYLRTLLIHGARSVLMYAKDKTDHRSKWVMGLAERRGNHKACVALANKNARVAWALLSKKEDFKEAV